MISITKTPYTYQPAGNDSIFQIESNSPNIISFIVKILESTSGEVIFNGNYYVRPDHTTGVSFNLSNVLSNFVQVSLNNSISIAEVINGSTLTYRLSIIERLAIDGQTVNGESYNSIEDKFTVWDAKIDRILFKGFQPNDYVINSTSLAKFLDIKPSISKQTLTSNEHLYFINGDASAKQVRIRTFNFQGVETNAFIEDLPDGLMVRLNVSPKYLFSTYDVDATRVNEYKVDLLDEDSEVISETKTYKLVSDSCYLEPINFLFTNSKGGVTSYVFYNPTRTINTTKTTLKSNILQLNSGVYSDNVNGILNQSERIINTNSTSTYTVFSNPLSDVETIYLSELISSSNVYIQLLDETLVPITIKNSNYQVALRKTNGGKLHRLEIQYSM